MRLLLGLSLRRLRLRGLVALVVLVGGAYRRSGGVLVAGSHVVPAVTARGLVLGGHRCTYGAPFDWGSSSAAELVLRPCGRLRVVWLMGVLVVVPGTAVQSGVTVVILWSVLGSFARNFG